LFHRRERRVVPDITRKTGTKRRTIELVKCQTARGEGECLTEISNRGTVEEQPHYRRQGKKGKMNSLGKLKRRAEKGANGKKSGLVGMRKEGQKKWEEAVLPPLQGPKKKRNGGNPLPRHGKNLKLHQRNENANESGGARQLRGGRTGPVGV